MGLPLYEKALKDLKAAQAKLKKQEVMLGHQKDFIDRVGENDRLFVMAYKVWKRKGYVKRVPVWVRANSPEEQEAEAKSS